jgi:glutamine amidotransferase
MKNNFIAIIDGGGANFTSVQAALDRLNIKSVVTADPSVIAQASHVILPGVGAAGYAMKLLNEKKLSAVIREIKQPLLGICLGQQLLCESSDEDDAKCLELIPLKVVKLEGVRVVPHMGWNNLTYLQENDPLFAGISTKDNFYFVHSFAPQVDLNYTIGICDYGVNFSAVIKKNNFYGVQFHPEKSGAAGMKLLRNFFLLCSKSE